MGWNEVGLQRLSAKAQRNNFFYDNETSIILRRLKQISFIRGKIPHCQNESNWSFAFHFIFPWHAGQKSLGWWFVCILHIVNGYCRVVSTEFLVPVWVIVFLGLNYYNSLATALTTSTNNLDMIGVCQNHVVTHLVHQRPLGLLSDC